MAKVTYTHPHVAVSKYAVRRTSTVTEDTNIPVLFSAFRAVKGPDNELRKIYSLSDFIDLYGEESFVKFSDTDHELLNISNWLSNGGSVLAYRLADNSAANAKASSSFGGFKIPVFDDATGAYRPLDDIIHFRLESKYPGTYYNGLKIQFYAPSMGQMTIRIVMKVNGVETTIESIRLIDTAKGIVALQSSEYLNVKGNKWLKTEVIETPDIPVTPPETPDPENPDEGGEDTDNGGTGEDDNETLEKVVSRRIDYNTYEVVQTDDEAITEMVKGLLSLTSGQFRALCENPSKYFVDEYDNPAISKPIGGGSGYTITVRSDYSYFEVEYNNYAEETLPTRSAVEKEYAKILGFILPNENVNSANLSRLEFEPKDENDEPIVASVPALYNTLEYRIDVVLDAGYSLAMKRVLLEYALLRDDINFYLDMFTNTNTFETYRFDSVNAIYNLSNYISLACNDPTSSTTYEDQPNVGVSVGYFIAENIWTENDIKVGLSYYYSSKLISNDLTNGLQFPVAGLTRGALTNIKGMMFNPTPALKTALYNSKLNYVEKDSRGYKIMNQLTRTVYNTALVYLNNSLVTNRIARDIRDIAREYLFEFIDSTTLNNMSNVLNKYLSEWLQNRTLSVGECEVTKLSENSVNVALNIKYVGTIEIISMDIVVE